MKKLLCLIALLWSVLSVGAHPGTGIVMDSKGNVFYTDLKQVWKIDTKGKKSVIIHKVHTHELFVDKEDNLYGEHLWYNGEAKDTWGHYVWKYSSEGKFEKVIPDSQGFLKDYSFVRDQQGNMYWADRDNKCQKIIRRDPSGKNSRLGDQCFENIRWMTVTPEGIVYLIDLYDLKKIDAQGKVHTVAPQLQEKKLMQTFVDDPHHVYGLTTDKNQNVYVAIQGGRNVKKIAPSGEVFTVVKTETSWSPTGVLYAPNGDLWILENSPLNEVRVERIGKDGKRTIY